MFHLIKKYSNRKMYDTCSKKFVTLDELLELILQREEIRIEDSDTHIEITDLEVSKAVIRYINSSNSLPDKVSELLRSMQNRETKKESGTLAQVLKFFGEDISSPRKSKSGKKPRLEEPETEITNEGDMAYIPAEIRLLVKSSQYIEGAIQIMKDETPFNQKLHDDVSVLFKEIKKKVDYIKKRYRIE